MSRTTGSQSMRAALYARYSSDKQREASIADQFRNCERACGLRGWRVVRRFADEAQSGAKADRVDYQALLEAAKRKEFDVIVIDEISRLWRDQEEQARAVKLLGYHGVDILGVSDGVNTQNGGHRLLMSIRGAMNEEARQEIGWRTHRGQEGQARKGLRAGGKVYGYRNVRVDDGVKLEVDMEQAEWVRWIFERFSEGWGAHRIATELNRLGVPPPGAGWNRKRRQCLGWAQGAILGDAKRGFGVLRNPLYNGVHVWNRTKRIINPETGARRHELRPESEVVKIEAPELRIVSQSLWDQVQSRLRQRQLKSEQGCRGAKSSGGRGPKYPFSGLLRCGVCGGRYVMVNDRNYGCSNHRERGGHVCSNGLVVKRSIVESRILDGVKHDLVTPEAMERFRKKVAELRVRSAKKKRAESVSGLVGRAEREIKNIVEAVKAGRHSPTLLEELARLESERERLQTQLQSEASRQEGVTRLLPRLDEVYRDLVENLEATLSTDADRARQLLRALVGDEIPLTPRGAYLEAELKGNYAGLLGLTGVGYNCGTEERT